MIRQAANRCNLNVEGRSPFTFHYSLLNSLHETNLHSSPSSLHLAAFIMQ